MRLRFWLGAEQWELTPGQRCPEGCQPLPGTADPYFANLWLRPLGNDLFRMAALREVLGRATGHGWTERLSDAEVIQRACDLLKTGALHVHSTGERLGKGGAQPRAPLERVIEPLPVPTRRPPPPPRRAAPQDDPSFLESSADQAAIAGVLKAAAAAGVPFCEECKKGGNG